MNICKIIKEEINDFDWAKEVPMASEILKYVKEKHYNSEESIKNGRIYLTRDGHENDCWFVNEDDIDEDADNSEEPYNCREHGLVIEFHVVEGGYYRVGEFENIYNGQDISEILESDLSFHHRVSTVSEVLEIVDNEL